MGKAQTTNPDTTDQQRLAAFMALEGDICDMLQQCRITDFLTEEANSRHGQISSDFWDLLRFSTFQSTLRAIHLQARFYAAFEGKESAQYGNTPRGTEAAHGQ
jgi:hypothetical protein